VAFLFVVEAVRQPEQFLEEVSGAWR